jgi:DNA-binding response OmpR family regulator
MDMNWKHGVFHFQPRGMLPPPPPTVCCGELEVDRARRRAAIAGTDLHLTERECALLLCLADHANRVVKRSDLLAEVWMLPDDDGSNLVAVYIRRLRQKLGVHASMIKTIRGIGYRLRAVMPVAEG